VDRRRLWLAAVAALVPAVPIIVAVALTSGQAATPARVTILPFRPEPIKSAARPALPSGPGVLVAVMTHPATMRAAPAGRPIGTAGLKSQFGSPDVMWVVQHRPGWLGVVSPVAGNGRVGWIPQASASLVRVVWKLEVSLSSRRLTVFDDEHPRQRYAVAIGMPDAPTPTGRFAVTDRLVTGNDQGPYGCCILALSAHSPHTIQGWTGGDRIAIHSTPIPDPGQADSHGCIHVSLAEGRWLLAHIPLGTPALITS
jgi:lipoprotein-anchoring transpeptidase ErfK/SrfK